MLAVLDEARVCRLALCDDGLPYVVPVCYGYDGEALYFHSAPRGRKLEIIRRNPDVCFQVDVGAQLVREAAPCRCTMRYRSVIGYGRAHILADPAEKVAGLRALMDHYADGEWEFSPDSVERVAVVRIDVDKLTGKSNGY